MREVPALVARRAGSVYVANSADLWGRGMAALWPAPQRLTLGAFDGAWQAYTRRKADAVTVISTDLERRAEALGIPSTRIRRIPIGANDDLFIRSRPPKHAAGSVFHTTRWSWRTPVSPLSTSGCSRILCCGLAARATRLPAHVGRAVQLVLQRAAAAGATGRLRHVGVVPYADLGSVIACADATVVPYASTPHNEARFPNRVGDYLAAGRPVVTNPTGDLGTLVAKERFGLAVPAAPEPFARAIVELLRRPALRDAMGRRARALAETTFSWRAAAARLAELYEELAQAEAVAGPRSSSSS